MSCLVRAVALSFHSDSRGPLYSRVSPAPTCFPDHFFVIVCRTDCATGTNGTMERSYCSSAFSLISQGDGFNPARHTHTAGQQTEETDLHGQHQVEDGNDVPGVPRQTRRRNPTWIGHGRYCKRSSDRLNKASCDITRSVKEHDIKEE